MAQYIYAAAAPDRALTAALLSSTNILVGTSSSENEVNIVGLTAKSGLHRFVFSSAIAAGTYRVVIVDNVLSIGVAVYEAKFTGVAEETVQATEFVAAAADLASLEANQLTIISKISPITTVYTAQPQSESINLIRGDAYDGVANAKLAWTATKDVDGETINFTIRDSKDAIVLDQSTAGVITSATGTLVEVALSTEATELLDPAVSIYKFDVEVAFSASSRWTITKGNVCVEGDESR